MDYTSYILSNAQQGADLLSLNCEEVWENYSAFLKFDLLCLENTFLTSLKSQY